ncbi:MerR family transcriptional regulator [Nocardioides mangrovicus]|uniref:MerR family transcriptional regulator n=1 Tax=Nocardioides mangrovicus TaxID=2478913 RepID=A0A3L8NYJ6_9ACTN|nr:MerR family transcriptional regulator [Nocardioides mangrovicus]RLV47841.1 MerR family transcriptional regulator [Nocardioides mangrovicus]
MARQTPRAPGPRVPVYVISVAAELTGLHPQTLRTYDRIGLVSPGRTGGGGRRYSLHDIELLREVAELTSSGIGLEGVRRILELEHQVAALRARNAELKDRAEVLQAALDTAVGALRDRRPNLPVLRSTVVSPFDER